MWWGWNGSSTFSNSQTLADNTGGTANPNIVSKLYVDNASPIPPMPPSNFVGVPTVNNFNGSGSNAYISGAGLIDLTSLTNTRDMFDCNPTVRALILSAPLRDTASTKTLLKLTSDTSQYVVFQDQQHYQNKKLAYQYLDSTNGYTTDSNKVLKAFYDSAKVATIGKLAEVSQHIKDGNFGTASSVNAGLSTNNTIEDNNKRINYYYLLRLNDSTYQYSSADSLSIYNIAVQCPAEGGEGVWQARVLLSRIVHHYVDFDNKCGDGKHLVHHSTNPPKSIVNANFKLYPNPNDGTMVLEYHLPEKDNGEISILDLSGRVLKKYLINSKNYQLNISENELSAGTYFYKILVNDLLVKTDKLIIIK